MPSGKCPGSDDCELQIGCRECVLERDKTSIESHLGASLNAMKDRVHALAVEKGWWSERVQERPDAEFVSNLHGEVSEFWEAYRKGELDKPCDKEGCRLTCREEELADVVIRVLDYCGAHGIDIGAAVLAKHEYNKTRPFRHGGKEA